LRRWQLPALLALALTVLGAGLYVPFYLTLQTQVGGILPNLIYPTRFQQTVVMFGPVMLPVGLLLGWWAVRGRAWLDRGVAVWVGVALVAVLSILAGLFALVAAFRPELAAYVDQAIAPLTRSQAIGLLLQRRLLDSAATLVPALLVALVAGLAVGAMRKQDAPGWLRSPSVLITLAMILTGALLLVGPEFVYLRDNFGTRMNTIFKFYFQVWVLWGLASAFGLWYILAFARPVFARVTAGLVSLAVALGLVYTVTGVWSKANGFAGPANLDGMAFFAQQNPDDWAAIEWLQKNVSGAPTIVETAGGAYSAEGRISMATGLPTLMGWTNHEGQWRGRYYTQVAARPDEVRQLYQTRDWETAQAILDRYGIQYVIVGALERDRYQPLYDAKFDEHMLLVFASGNTLIYQRYQGQE
jgi:uncharacterized membrane protein